MLDDGQKNENKKQWQSKLNHLKMKPTIELTVQVSEFIAPTLFKTLAFYSKSCDKVNLSGYNSPEEPDSF